MNAKKLIAAAVFAATTLGSVAAHAGYYVPTCIPAHWEMGYFGLFWVPMRCF